MSGGKEIMNQNRYRARQGWTAQEHDILRTAVEGCRAENMPLRRAFDETAARTGRKSNSVRNYYYASVREGLIDAPVCAPSFRQFEMEEVNRLVEYVLCAQADGKSVRSTVMELGENDRTAMLRYQNKYRSVVKNRPELVLSIIEKLKAEGKRAFNPYEDEKPTNVGRKPGSGKKDIYAAVNRLTDALKTIPGIDAQALLEQLAALADIAAIARIKQTG